MQLLGKAGVATVHEGEVPNAGNVDVVLGGHGMVAAAPWIPGQRERVHKGEQKKRNSKVKEWKRKRDGVTGNLLRKLASLGRRTPRSSPVEKEIVRVLVWSGREVVWLRNGQGEGTG